MLTIGKYFLAILAMIVCALVLLEYAGLPLYVGYNNEHYLPDVRDHYLDKAQIELNKLGYSTEVIVKDFSTEHEPGTIISMSPRPFTKVKEGRTIVLTMAGERKELTVPNFMGESIRNAILETQRLGLVIDTVMEEFNSNFSNDIISYQSPKSGKLVKSGSAMTFMVSKGAPPDFFRVPDVINISLAKAREIIVDAGLKVGNVIYEINTDLVNDTVIDQSLTAGMKLAIPARIDLVVSKEK
ncbi:MAG: PASTA domain-containing protein [Candidatus Marinimicrobia bacterium]|nr:PASTA domain-containing protein [Candidatus Neomarinimicrobiota bacterium]